MIKIIAIFFCLNACAVPMSTFIPLSISSHGENLAVKQFYNEHKYCPLPHEEDPHELSQLFADGNELLMVPSSNLSLLLSNKFKKITLFSTYNSALRFSSFLHENFNNNKGPSYIESVKNNFLEEQRENIQSSHEITALFNKHYKDLIFRSLKPKTKLARIFNKKPKNPSTIFFSTLLEHESTKLKENLEQMSSWLEDGHTIIFSLSHTSQKPELNEGLNRIFSRFTCIYQNSVSIPQTTYYHCKNEPT